MFPRTEIWSAVCTLLLKEAHRISIMGFFCKLTVREMFVDDDPNAHINSKVF
jgi:hypothetical protein